MTIPQPLAPMGLYNQFITYALRPKPGTDKFDKVPTHWHHKTSCNPMQQDSWTSYDVAYSAGNGCVGFVFTDQDPFFFLDIDNCLLPDGTWSPLAQRLCTLFAGAAIEVSQSGKGLHIYGVGYMPPHGCRNAAAGLELYHTGRFAALGNPLTCIGNAAHDCTEGLRIVVAEYFSMVRDVAAGQWSMAPVPEWRGPEDDDDLIRRMRASKSAAGAFGTKATADNLWCADVVSLSVAYPSTEPGKLFDASSADAALAQHLAFWTGKNADRMLRIMRQSLLIRPKWDRDDYIQGTILKAIGLCTAVCQDKPLERHELGVVHDILGGTVLRVAEQKEFFKGMAYIADIDRIIVPGGHTYDKQRFDSVYGGYTFVLDNDNEKMGSSAWDCFTKSRAVRFTKAHTASFRPDLTPGAVWTEGNQQVYNSYHPIVVPSVPGNPKPFLDHLAKLLPDERDRTIILSYMAAVVQHKGVKFQWCPLLQGTRGNGKTLLSVCLIEAIGRQHCHSPKASEICEKYNSWQEGRIFIAVEDIYVPKERQEMLEILKPMITSSWQEIRGMRMDKVSKHVCCNFMLNSNHKDALRHSEDNRSLAVFFTAQQSVADLHTWGMGDDYFPNLWNWLKRDGFAIVTNYLQEYQIPPEYNPARNCHRAPATTSTQAAIKVSKGIIEQEVEECIRQDKPGFRGGWVSAQAFTLLVDSLRIRIARNKRGEILEGLGYIRHPGLKRGQTLSAVAPDGVKTQLYCLPDHPSIGLCVGVAVELAYTNAQVVQLHVDTTRPIL